MEFINTQKVISKYFDEKLLSNVAIKIGKGSDVYGELYCSEKGKITETTLFDMASVTKIMATTLLTFIAIDEKQLSFDTLVADVFSQTPMHFKDLKISEQRREKKTEASGGPGAVCWGPQCHTR